MDTGISGSWLKLIACVSMLIDHIALHVFKGMDWVHSCLFQIGNHEITPYFVMRNVIGRWAFPLFAFLIVEGFLHTHDRKWYGMNLFLFALMSEIPFNFVNVNNFFYYKQNVFFTLLLGYLGLCAIERFKEDFKQLAKFMVSLFLLSFVLRADYGCGGFGFILLIYLLRENKLLMSIVGTGALPTTIFSGIAFIPIWFYNGERGFVRGKVWKYAFYCFYPVHLLVLYFIKLHIYGP
jgi:hypothetical protein